MIFELTIPIINELTNERFCEHKKNALPEILWYKEPVKCCRRRHHKIHTDTNLTLYTLVTQPMSQLRPNRTELRSMDYYHQIFCRFRKCKRKVPPPLLLSNDFEKSCFSSAIFSSDFFSKLTFLNSR